MKRTDEDIQFAELLKAHMPETSENPWFTRKVMNRLPYKPKTMPRWIKAVGYGICIMLMVIRWVIYVSHCFLDVRATGEIYTFVCMVGTTAYLAFAALHEFIKAQDHV